MRAGGGENFIHRFLNIKGLPWTGIGNPGMKRILPHPGEKADRGFCEGTQDKIISKRVGRIIRIQGSRIRVKGRKI